MSTSLEVWIGALLTLAAWSFIVVGSNVFFSVAEQILIGAVAGYQIGVAFTSLKDLAFTPLIEGQYVLIIPIAIGALLFTRYFKRAAWLSRIGVALMVALSTGVSVTGTVQSQILAQAKATMVAPTSISNMIILVGAIAVLRYFFFTREANNPVERGLTLLGRYVMMGAFGAAFGNTVHGRFSVLITHCQYMLYTWLGLG